MITVDALTPDEWQIIRGVRLRSLHDAPHAFTSTYQRELAFDEPAWRLRATTGQWFVATDGGVAIGVAGGIDGWSDDPVDRELVGRWVDPSHRGRGVGRHLLDAVAAWAASVGATTLRLGVRAGNQGGRKAYLRMGLQATGETMTSPGAPDEAIEVMVLDLAHG
jgi:GNAT superfamily N-acetyltransferase